MCHADFNAALKNNKLPANMLTEVTFIHNRFISVRSHMTDNDNCQWHGNIYADLETKLNVMTWGNEVSMLTMQISSLLKWDLEREKWGKLRFGI